MKLRLTKTSKIVFPIAIVLLSVALGFLVWRVNQPEKHLAAVDTEAASTFCQDADLVLTVSKHVCGKNCFSFSGDYEYQCPPQQIFTINVPKEGTYDLKGVVGRGHCDENGCQCQNNEEFYLKINGKVGINPVEDDITSSSPSLCIETTIQQDLGEFDLKEGSNTVFMNTAAPTCLSRNQYPPNSVNLYKICLYAESSCGDEVVDIEAGEECDPPESSCTVGGKSGTCSNECTCDVNPFCGDGNLDPNETCELGDPTGSECTWTSCNQTTCTCLAPGLNISKSVVESCNGEGTQNPVSQLTYTIKVENTGPGIGSVLKIEDVLDSKVVSAGITPSGITTPGQYSNGVILWDFSSSPLVVEAGSSQTYTYTLSVDKENFGLYDNTVTLTPTQGNALQAVASISADCEIVEPSVPQTGLFDTTLGRISVGFLLLLVGGMVYNIPNKAFIFKSKPVNYKYRDRFEQKVAKK